MKAFWWFEENSIAGMARPGFNYTHWFDLPYEEAVLLSWLGQYSSGSATINQFQRHLDTHCPKIAPFYNISENESQKIINNYQSKAGVLAGFQKLSRRTKLLANFDVTDNEIHFEFCRDHLNDEISFLKTNGFKKIITLTEQHHSKDILQEHFDLHHFSIIDLCAPTFEQVSEMAEILQKAKTDKQPLAVHCLAGIGRTSTMLIAAHLAMGHSLEHLKALIQDKNPTYKLTGSQAEFIESVSQQLT